VTDFEVGDKQGITIIDLEGIWNSVDNCSRHDIGDSISKDRRMLEIDPFIRIFRSERLSMASRDGPIFSREYPVGAPFPSPGPTPRSSNSNMRQGLIISQVILKCDSFPIFITINKQTSTKNFLIIKLSLFYF